MAKNQRGAPKGRTGMEISKMYTKFVVLPVPDFAHDWEDLPENIGIASVFSGGNCFVVPKNEVQTLLTMLDSEIAELGRESGDDTDYAEYVQELSTFKTNLEDLATRTWGPATVSGD